MEDRKKRPDSPIGPNGECCERCRFYKPINGGHAFAADYNYCRESSPVVFAHASMTVRSSQEDVTSYKHLSTWPRSHKFDWCGKFDPK